MATSEIEKLERRYTENPHGLTFAPLAEVHRKNGDIPRALELLTAGLELHPNYIPASIVLGRCHQDRNDLAAAEAAFAHVLRLDDENVIALKSLADISERQERHTEAEGWLRRLVAVDRSNEDAKEQLARVQAAKASGFAPPAAAPAAVEPKMETPAPPPVLEMIDLGAEPELNQAVPEAESEAASTEQAKDDRLPEPELPEPELPEPELKLETEPAPVGEVLSERRDVPLPFIETAAPEQVAEPAMEVLEEAPPAPEPVAAAAEPEPAPEPAPSASEEEVRPLAGLISAEFQPPLEAIGGLGVETSDEVLLEVSGSSEFSVPDASEDLKSVAARLAEPRQAGPSEELSVPGEDVAAGVEATPAPIEDLHPPIAAAPAAAVEAPASGSAEPEWMTPEPPRRQYLARETNGQSVGAFFRALLSARLLPSSGDMAASSGRNGGSAFDDGEEGLPVPPAVSAPEQNAEAAVSFDDFFGSEPSGPGPSRADKSDRGKDDLDQFQSWLQNLKR